MIVIILLIVAAALLGLGAFFAFMSKDNARRGQSGTTADIARARQGWISTASLCTYLRPDRKEKWAISF